MGDNYEGDSLGFVEVEEEFHDFVAGGGVEVAGGFVGEDDFGVVDYGAGDADALFLASGEVVGAAFGFVFELDGENGLLGAFFAGAAAEAGDFEREDDVVEDGVAAVHEELLEDEAEFAVSDAVELFGLEAGAVDAADADAAGGGFVEEGEVVHEGGFAGARFADDGDGFAFGNC